MLWNGKYLPVFPNIQWKVSCVWTTRPVNFSWVAAVRKMLSLLSSRIFACLKAAVFPACLRRPLPLRHACNAALDIYSHTHTAFLHRISHTWSFLNANLCIAFKLAVSLKIRFYLRFYSFSTGELRNSSSSDVYHSDLLLGEILLSLLETVYLPAR